MLSLAPMPIMMSFFMLIYSVWWGFAFGTIGWLLFSLVCVYAVYLITRAIRNFKKAKSYPQLQTSEGEKISKAMGILSGISYGILWVVAIILFITKQYRWILPAVTFIIALHFFPQASIFKRKIDYFLGLFPLVSSLIGFYLASQNSVDWSIVYAVTGTGGANATGGYGIYLLRSYNKIAME